MASRIANITQRGADRRRLGGYVWLAIGIVAAVALVLMHAPRPTRAALVIPFGLAAMGLLQAREKT